MGPPFNSIYFNGGVWWCDALRVCLLGDLGDLRFHWDDRSSRGLKQSLQIGLQIAPVFRSEVDKFEGLKIAFRRPHGKEHAHFRAYRVFSNVKDHFNLDPLIQRGLQMQQPTGDRELVQTAASLPSVFQTHQRQDSACKFHPWSSGPAV